MVYFMGPNSKLLIFVTKIHKRAQPAAQPTRKRAFAIFRRYVQIFTLVQIYRLGARYFYRCILPVVEEHYILFETRKGIKTMWKIIDQICIYYLKRFFMRRSATVRGIVFCLFDEADRNKGRS